MRTNSDEIQKIKPLVSAPPFHFSRQRFDALQINFWNPLCIDPQFLVKTLSKTKYKVLWTTGLLCSPGSGSSIQNPAEPKLDTSLRLPMSPVTAQNDTSLDKEESAPSTTGASTESLWDHLQQQRFSRWSLEIAFGSRCFRAVVPGSVRLVSPN